MPAVDTSVCVKEGEDEAEQLGVEVVHGGVDSVHGLCHVLVLVIRDQLHLLGLDVPVRLEGHVPLPALRFGLTESQQ